MARPVSPRPPAEQLNILSRIKRQVEIDEQMNVKRRKGLLKDLTSAMTHLERETTKRG